MHGLHGCATAFSICPFQRPEDAFERCGYRSRKAENGGDWRGNDMHLNEIKHLLKRRKIINLQPNSMKDETANSEKEFGDIKHAFERSVKDPDVESRTNYLSQLNSYS
jgi:hypothetical protein